MKKVAIVVALILILSGCSTKVEPPEATPTATVQPTPSPVVTMEVVQSEPPVEPSEPVESEPVESEPVFYLDEYERWVVECMVMGESGSEPYEGQVLVAQCILNACLKDRILPSKVRVRYKYSGWKENPTESVKRAVSAVFDDGYQITNEPILYFYAPKYSAGRFHETQCHVITVGGHKFFKEWEDWN
jgi:hypothetical protein